MGTRIKHATILTKYDWQDHVDACNKEFKGGHNGIASGSFIPGIDTTYPNPPFLCYSILSKATTMNGDLHAEWTHVCFMPVDAGILGAHAQDVYEQIKREKREELEKTQPERLKQLAADLDLEDDPAENLGTITLKDALEAGDE